MHFLVFKVHYNQYPVHFFYIYGHKYLKKNLSNSGFQGAPLTESTKSNKNIIEKSKTCVAFFTLSSVSSLSRDFVRLFDYSNSFYKIHEMVNMDYVKVTSMISEVGTYRSKSGKNYLVRPL